MSDNFTPANVIDEGYTLEQGLRSVGFGWTSLILVVFDTKPDTIKIVQVKEKFGSLRIYHDPYNQKFQKIISGMEMASGSICEWCGKVGSSDTLNYWIKTLCDDCKKKRRGYRNT